MAEAVCNLFADDGWIGALVGSLAERMRDNPWFEPPFRFLNSDIQSGLLVFEHELVSIAAGTTGAAQLAARKNVTRQGVSVAFTGYVTILKFVRAGGATLSFWEAPEIDEDFNAAEAGRCVRTGARRIGDGETIVVDGRRQSYVIEHAGANILLVQANVQPGHAPLSVEYDARTGAFVGCSASDDRASRVQMMMTLLRKLDHPEAFAAIAPFLEDPSFFVRWHAMRELLGIDAGAAYPRLARMAQADPHPDARRAARAVLDRLVVAHPTLGGAATCRA